ncbi:MAG: SGNH/GDSL hydrolase family protein [Ktedonobacteraceae bacterium]
MKVKRIVSAFVLSFFLTACGTARVATQQAVLFSTPPSLIVLGDSISAGQYLPTSTDAYPYVLAADLHTRLTIYAASGHTTAQTRSMYTKVLAPTYIVIELGTNDYNYSIPLATFTATYHSIVTSIAPATRVVCLSVWDPANVADTRWSSPQGIPSPFNRVGASPATYNAIIEKSCRGKYLSLQAIFATSSYHGSGSRGRLYHPNVAGDAAIARLIVAAF